MQQTMKKMLDTSKVPALLSILLGEASPTPAQDLPDVVFENAFLNDSQKHAVRTALAARELALIHGPPGVSSVTTSVH